MPASRARAGGGIAALLAVAMLTAAAVAPQPVAGVANIPETFVGGNDMAGIIARFNTWMDAVGCESKVETAHIPGFRLGLVAREDIAQGEVYLAVPWNALIHEEAIEASPVGVQFKALKAKYELDVFHYLMLFLLHELDNPDSHWRPFLDILPGSLNTPIFWDGALLDELEGTKIPGEARKYRANARANFDKDRRIIEANVDLFGQVVLDKLDFDRYLWASNVLDSRTIWVDGRHRVFLPVLDMANNKDHPTRAHRTVRNPATGASNTPAIWAVKKGEQLFENYNSPNFDNLLYHGFVLAENSHETVELQMPQPDREYYPVLSSVRARPMYSVFTGQGLAPEVFAHARIVTQPLDKLDPADAAQFLKAGDALSEFNAMAWLERVLGQALARFPAGTSLEGDRALLAATGDGAVSDDMRTILTYRVAQRGIYQAAADDVAGRKAAVEDAARAQAAAPRQGEGGGGEPQTKKKKKKKKKAAREL